MRRISVFGATGSIGESTFDLLMRQGGPSALLSSETDLGAVPVVFH